MVHRFPSFEIDEAARELRAGARVWPLQPRVFDLLLFLVKNRERVVPKEELLKTLWSGVIVADGSLQRAVSVARSALGQAGAPDAIRTYSRCGYRFCAQGTDGESGAAGSGKPVSSALERARADYARGDWAGVIGAMAQVKDYAEVAPADLQAWVQAVQGCGPTETNLQPLERAVAGLGARGQRRRAAWLAILLAQLRLERREQVLANGWQHRAARLLDGEPPCRERGYLDLVGCRIALLQNEIETALALAERARQAGERFEDADLEGVGLVYVGEAQLYLGNVRQGLAALDEAGVAVVANGLSPWAGGLIYCGVIYSCMTRADWQRAGQWTKQFQRWGEDKGAVAYPGLCQIHRAEVLTIRGDLREAERQIRATQALLARQAPWAEGEAWRVWGEIRLAKGEFSGARKALTRATELGWESQFELALVRFAEGDASAAARMLARTIAEDQWSCRVKRGRALAHHCIIAASAGDLAAARESLAVLEREPDLMSTPALGALTAFARGELAAAERRVPEGIALLRSALHAWLALEAPLPAAQTRCRLATWLRTRDDAESAALELTAAEAAYRRAGAVGWLRQCDKLRQAWQSTARRCLARPRTAVGLRVHA